MNSDFSQNLRQELESKLTALLLGELSAEDAELLRKLIAHDPELTQLHDQLKLTIELVRETAADPIAQASPQAAPLKLSEEKREKLLAQFKTVAPKEFAQPRRSAGTWLIASAAVAAIVLFVMALVLPNFVQARKTSNVNAILNNLRQLDGAKQQWALENGKSAEDVPTFEDVEVYLGRGTAGKMPDSVMGETYVLGKVSESPKIEVAAAQVRKSFKGLPEAKITGVGGDHVRVSLLMDEPVSETRALAFTTAGVSAKGGAMIGERPYFTRGEPAASGHFESSTIRGPQAGGQIAAVPAPVSSVSTPRTAIVLPTAGQPAENNMPGVASADSYDRFTYHRLVEQATDNDAQKNRDGLVLNFASPPAAMVSAAAARASGTTLAAGEKTRAIANSAAADPFESRVQQNVQSHGEAVAGLVLKAAVPSEQAPTANSSGLGSRFFLEGGDDKGNGKANKTVESAGAALETRTFRVDPNTLHRVLENVGAIDFSKFTEGRTMVAGAGGMGGGGGGGGGAGGGGFGGGGGVTFVPQTNSASEIQEGARNFYLAAGVNLDPKSGKDVFYNDRTGELTVRGTARDLDIVAAANETLAVAPPQINIKAKFVEVDENGRPKTSKPAMGLPTLSSPPVNVARAENESEKPNLLGDTPVLGHLFRTQGQTVADGGQSTTSQHALSGGNNADASFAIRQGFVDLNRNQANDRLDVPENLSTWGAVQAGTLAVNGTSRFTNGTLALNGGNRVDTGLSRDDVEGLRSLYSSQSREPTKPVYSADVVGYYNLQTPATAGTPSQTGVIPMKFAKAGDIASAVNSLSEANTTTHSAGVVTAPERSRRSNIVLPAYEPNTQVGTATVSADNSGNLVVVGDEATVEQIRRTVTAMDRPAAQTLVGTMLMEVQQAPGLSAPKAAGSAAERVHNATVYYEARKLDEAEAELKSALNSEPNNMVAYNLSRLVQQARTRQAIARQTVTSEKKLAQIEDAWNEPVKRYGIQVPNPWASTNAITVATTAAASHRALTVTNLDQALSAYAALSGKTVLRPANLANVNFVLRSQAPLNQKEALQALDSVLALNGVSVVDAGDKLKVVAQGQVHTTAAPGITDVSVAKPAVAPPVPQPEVQTRDNAFSTFSLNVSDVSFKLAGASLEKGALPDPAGIRSEEFINAFDYRDPEAAPGAAMAFASERARYPFAYNRDLLRFSIKTAAAGRQAGRPLNLVLLLDNSGSMERADRVGIIREALRVLASELQPQDTISVVTFSRTARLWVDGLPGNKAGDVADGLSDLTPQGGTNLEDAMNLAYATALRHYLANGINRVVLLTDGAANLGDVDPDTLKQKVEAHRQQGIALDCFGIGWEGYNDDLLEVLSRNGDGRYGFINSREDAATDFAAQLAGALQVAASDVKVQVEFNPKRVTSYRQIGYAKHQLTKEQFRDNTVDAAEIAAQEAGNALYTVEVNPAGEGPLGTVHVRYKIPGTSDYREQEWAVPFSGNAAALEQSSPAMRLAATASAFSEWLATSPYAAEVTTDRLLNYLTGVPEIYGADARPKTLEWMIRQAKSISGK